MLYLLNIFESVTEIVDGSLVVGVGKVLSLELPRDEHIFEVLRGTRVFKRLYLHTIRVG